MPETARLPIACTVPRCQHTRHPELAPSRAACPRHPAVVADCCLICHPALPRWTDAELLAAARQEGDTAAIERIERGATQAAADRAAHAPAANVVPDTDQQRDFAEEAYWRAFCPECGTSPCTVDGEHYDGEPDPATYDAELFADAAAEYVD